MSTTMLYVQPDGVFERTTLPDSTQRQQSTIADLVDGPVTSWRLGRHMTVHTAKPGPTRTRNEIARETWRTFGRGQAPDLRGVAVITGAPYPDGRLQSIPDATLEVATRWADILRGASISLRPDVCAVQDRGTRDEQCDAFAIRRDAASGRWAYVVLDGIGDDEEVCRHVRTWAPVLARSAARLGDPAAAIAEVRESIAYRRRRCWSHMDPGAVAVVAVYDRADSLIRVAWSGDARAYRLSHIDTIERLTKDHNYAQELMDAGRQPKAWDHHSVTSTLEEGEIGSVAAPAELFAQLILCSDGVYHPLETYEPGLLQLTAHMGLDAKGSAGSLVDDGVRCARRWQDKSDNATALVVAFPRPYTS
ncbi:serine/threonine protein phosphatase PrpC [Streptomyces sp. 3212.3]|uniref:PP2C family protein-serine/threonine phosphatase n=1 Tax=Streptomyces sp. 3212.3 TaxID=1938846 RepID=UPI000E25C44E|nr:hypothetical protein [Streptomyces sp. 3212.3]REE61475.1 serine/threonine protein phosphatase PrpC [Streptomyces sp. 3212.3]